MSKIAAFPITTSTGGIRRDKSLLEIQVNELLDAQNVDIGDRGRVRVRRGSVQVGQTLSGNLENSFMWERVVPGSTPVSGIYLNNDASSASVWRLLTRRVTSDVAVGATTINVTSTTSYSSSGTIEIDGDLIAYTGVTGTSFTGVTGVTVAHSSGASANQWESLTLASSTNGTRGITYIVLNNILFVVGAANWVYINNDDMVSTTAVSGEPPALYGVNYRSRLYSVGGGGSSGDPRRVFFSARGDGTTWDTTNDWFDVEDQSGEAVTGTRVLNDRLVLFKTNSIFTYDEIELKQRVTGAGAWNNKVQIDIDGIIYTFCPRGIFATNGLSATQIGEPVREFWDNFMPEYDSVTERVVLNTSAAKFGRFYVLYIGDITKPRTTNDVSLVYDTIAKAWTTYDGFVNARHLFGTDKYRFGDQPINHRSALFYGNSSGQYFRCYENRYVGRPTSATKYGTDIYTDNVSDTALTGGTPVNGMVEYLHDMRHPELFKTFRFLRVFIESGQWTVEYSTEDETGRFSAYKSLGTVSVTNSVLPFDSTARGFRIKLRFTSVNINGESVLNGYTFEDTELTTRH